MREGLIFSFALLLALAPWGAMRAAEEEKSEKEKLREAEAAAEEKLNPEDSARHPLLRGKVVLFSAENPEDPNVIGLFIVGNKRFKLEAANEELKAEFRKFNKKEVAVLGKIRDRGTTFIAEDIQGGGAPPGGMQSRGSL